MNLKEICHPLFQYICYLYRHQEKGQELPEDQVRSDIRRCFDAMHDAVIGNTILADQISKMELPLVFFVDYMIKEGPFAFSQNWVELARDFNELSGDEKFFDILDETLADPSPSATERISIFYTCIALGFYGCYASDPKYLERKIKICALRINLNSEMASQQPFGTDVYKTVSKENLFKDPRRVTRTILLVVMLIFISAIAANMIYFNMIVNKTRKRFHSVENIIINRHRPQTPQFLKMMNAEEKKEFEKQISLSKKTDQAPPRKYSEDEIRQSSWFPAYKAGSKLDEDYHPQKEKSAAKEKGEGNPLPQTSSPLSGAKKTE